MEFKFDHLVHFTDSPEDAGATLKSLGLHVVEGGKHEDGGTYNLLNYYGLSYIELIGVFDKKGADAPAEKFSLRDTFQKDNYANGFSKFALRLENLDKAAEHFKGLGFEVNGPVPLSRKKPDGSVLSWKLLFVGNDEDALEWPFFIDWEETDENRQHELQEQGSIREHERGKLELNSIGLAVTNGQEMLNKWSEILGLERGDSFIDDSLNATGYRLKLTGGDIIFYSPNGDGIVAETLTERGEKPFIVNLSGSERKEQFEVKNGIYRFI
jgi:hypothetical protein